MKRVTITLKINPEIWKEIQHKCVDESISYSDYVEKSLKKSLKEKEKKCQEKFVNYPTLNLDRF
jgi:hypothetical protein